MTADFYWNIEECRLHGTFELFSDMKMKVNFKVNQIKHVKGKAKSFQSRYIRSPEREKNMPEITTGVLDPWKRMVKKPESNLMLVIWEMQDKVNKFLDNRCMKEK